jgi:signal transduction histidine kinase
LAWEAFREAEKLKWASAAFLEESEFYFYGALAQTAFFNSAPAETKAEIAATLRGHQQRVALWAANCPENFADRSALIEAEMARIERRDQDAMRFYEQAIQLSRKNEFLHIEAIASETAAAFYDERGFETIARSYRRIARNAYDRWGAHAKVAQLDQRYPWLHEERSVTPRGTFGALAERLDVEAVVKASQAISGEIELDRLISTLMRIAMEHAGADRGLLVLSPAHAPQVEAEATVGEHEIDVSLRKTELASSALPISIVQYVTRTRETVLLEDARTPSTFSADAYLRAGRCRSVLCLPLIKQSELIAVLYLENGQASNVFTPARTMVLQLLASGAAISIENARLYEEGRRTEHALRLSEAELAEGQRISRTGSWRWNARTGDIQASAEHLRIFEIGPEGFNLAKYLEKVHPEDRRAVEAAIEQGVRNRSAFQYEYRIESVDGSIKYLQTTGQPRETAAGELEYVGTVLDMTARRHSEEALRLAQDELARASRLTFMGELAGSIIHEINQPLAAIVTNAETGLRWLRADAPDLDEIRDAVESVAHDARRAGRIVSGMRALARKASPDMQPVNVGEAVREVLAILRSEVERANIVVSLHLDDSFVLADRVQLQQVILNLARNAIEAMATVCDRGRELHLEMGHTDEDHVELKISDTGVGLEPGTAVKIFDPLFSTKAHGMGMGLSICRSIIEAHKGRLAAEAAPIHGTIFRFSLPPANPPQG